MLDNEDFYQEFVTALNKHAVKYMVFGGFALNMYGFTRVTEDLDVWLNPDPANLSTFRKAITELGFKEEQSLANFLSGNSIMLRISDGSFRVDLLTKINIPKSFLEAFQSSEIITLPYGKVHFLGYRD